MATDDLISVMTVFGTRPEAIKLAPVVRELKSRPGQFRSIVCVSAQHREMLDQVLDTFDIRPDFDLDVMRESQSPADVAASVLARLPGLLVETKPDVLLVQGDTMTTFSASLAAYLQRIPIGHVEAGLRTGNFDHPFPEEMNRCLTSRVSSFHFAPTYTARDALLSEGVCSDTVFVTGNTVIDALIETINRDHEFQSPDLQGLERFSQIILVTTHRRESFGGPMREVCHAIKRIAASRPEALFVLPIHPNPTVAEVVREVLSGLQSVRLVNPLPYRDFVNLMARSRVILTDSGGIQEEAPALDVPVLVLRETTERAEAVASGAARLIGTRQDDICRETLALLDDDSVHSEMASAKNPFGDGNSSLIIADILADRLRSSGASKL